MVVMIKVLVVEEAVRCYSCWIDIYIIVETIQTLTRYYFTQMLKTVERTCTQTEIIAQQSLRFKFKNALVSGTILFELSRFGEDDFVANNGLAIKLRRMLGFDGGYD